MEDSMPAEIHRTMFITSGGNKYFSEKMKYLIEFRFNREVKSYIKGINPSELVDSNKTSLLHLAAEYNNYYIVEDLIELKFDVNAEDDSKRTPLIMAVMSCKFKMAQVLIEANADIYDAKFSGKSGLQMLFSYNSTPEQLIEICLKRVKSDSSSDSEIAEKLFIAESPLHIVVSLEMPRVTRIFTELSGEVDNQQFCTAMHEAFKLEERENILALLQCRVAIDLRQIHLTSFLDVVYPFYNGDESCLTLFSAFFEKVSDWSSLRQEDIDPIDIIFNMSSKNILQIFLQHNIHTHVKNKFPERDLVVNIFGNHNADSRELLKHLEFDVNSHGLFGFTALHHAVTLGILAEVQALLDLGANPNCQDSRGHEPLFYVATDQKYDARHPFGREDLYSDERKILELLLLAGADVQIVTEDGFGGCDLMVFPTKSQMILAQLAIDASLGTPIKEAVRLTINRTQENREAYEMYCEQIEKLKATKVHCSVTLYDVLVMDTDKILNRIRNCEVLQTIMQSSDVRQFYFFYVNKLQHSVDKILHTMDLREKVTTFMCEVAGWPDSQYIVLEKILGFLTYKDLLVFDLL